MAIVIHREKETETLTSLDVPYYIKDAAIAIGDELDREAAVLAVGAQGVTDQGDAADDYRFEQLSYNVPRVTLVYHARDEKPRSPSTDGLEYLLKRLIFAERDDILSHALRQTSETRYHQSRIDG